MAFLKIKKIYHGLIIPGLILFLTTAALSADADDIKGPVVVDTDVALDDLRALTLLLSDGRFQIRAVVTSDGACSPERGAVNIRRALKFLDVGNIPVGAGRELDSPPPPWRMMSEAMGWADIPEVDSAPVLTAGDVFDRALGDIDSPVSYICLGPLSNLADWLREKPKGIEKIKAVYYYGSLPGAGNLSWNTTRDTAAAREVFQSGLTVYICSMSDSLLLPFNPVFYDSLCGMTAPGAAFLKKLHAGERVQHLLKSGHFIAWDETVALSLMAPAAVAFKPVEGFPSVYFLESFDRRLARQVYLKTLNGE